MSNYPAQAGKRYETDLMKYIRGQGIDVERLRLTGAEDEGDLLIRAILRNERFVVEAKRRKTLNLGGWIEEARVERDNYDKHRELEKPSGFVVVHHARGKGIGQSYVTTTLDEWMRNL